MTNNAQQLKKKNASFRRVWPAEQSGPRASDHKPAEGKNITANAYLGQAQFLDTRIKPKIQKIDSLPKLGRQLHVVPSNMPREPGHGASNAENCVMKIIEVQEGLQDNISVRGDLRKRS